TREPAPAPAAVRSRRKVWITGLATSLLLAGFVSFYASADPDGLEKVAGDHGIDEKAEEHPIAGSPLADYGVKDVDDDRLSGGLAGVIGVGVTVVAGTGVFHLVARRRREDAGSDADSPAGTSV
ncbi:PDGLE domain-containing protein, partial [Streptomyces pilosus]